MTGVGAVLTGLAAAAHVRGAIRVADDYDTAGEETFVVLALFVAAGTAVLGGLLVVPGADEGLVLLAAVVYLYLLPVLWGASPPSGPASPG